MISSSSSSNNNNNLSRKELHPIERNVLKILSEYHYKTPEEIMIDADLSRDQTRRALQWLKFKDMVDENDDGKGFRKRTIHNESDDQLL